MNTLVGARPMCLAAASPSVEHARCARERNSREVLAKHRPNHDRTSCVNCGFAYTNATPLCPSSADALRELASRPATWKPSPLGRYSNRELHTMVRQHRGSTRCGRCGFAYTRQMRVCPTARQITSELEARCQHPVPSNRDRYLLLDGQGLCAGKGAAWTVNGGEAAPWKRAIAACSDCPLLVQCEATLDARIAAGDKVRDQIMAGRLFNDTGHEVAAQKIEKFAASRKKAMAKDAKLLAARMQNTASGLPVPTPAGGQLTLFPSAAA